MQKLDLPTPANIIAFFLPRAAAMENYSPESGTMIFSKTNQAALAMDEMLRPWFQNPN
jgi:hypothetical protein